MMTTEFLHEIHQRQLVLDQLCSAWSSEQCQRGMPLYCGKGCSGCCSLAVNCTFPEAVLVAAALNSQQQARLRQRAPLLYQTATAAHDLKGWLAGYRSQAGPCPFLETDGACGIYAVRPLSCRALLSTREPQWCTTDFSRLTPEEKQAFMASLDRSVAAFPTHYAATPQEIGRELEEATLRQMEGVYGFALVGLLPWLVWLECEQGLSSRLAGGAESVQGYLADKGLDNPFLLALL